MTTGYWTNLAVGRIGKKARFETLENISSVFQNSLAFLGRIGKASLSKFPEIYRSMVSPTDLCPTPQVRRVQSLHATDQHNSTAAKADHIMC